MTNLDSKQAQYEELKLMLAINKYLGKWGKQYAVQTRNIFNAPQELFDQVVDQMAADGLLRKETGRNGALILVHSLPEGS
jgi:hypothetical protein